MITRDEIEAEFAPFESHDWSWTHAVRESETRESHNRLKVSDRKLGVPEAKRINYDPAARRAEYLAKTPGMRRNKVSAPLTPAQIALITTSQESGATIAARIGVSTSCVCMHRRRHANA